MLNTSRATDNAGVQQEAASGSRLNQFLFLLASLASEEAGSSNQTQNLFLDWE